MEGRLERRVGTIVGVTDGGREAFTWLFWAGLKNAACHKLAALPSVLSVQLCGETWCGFLKTELWLGCSGEASLGRWQWFLQTISYSGKLLCCGRFPAEILGSRLGEAVGVACHGKGLCLRWSSYTGLNWENHWGAAGVEQHKCSAFPLLPKPSPCCYENVLWKTCGPVLGLSCIFEANETFCSWGGGRE